MKSKKELTQLETDFFNYLLNFGRTVQSVNDKLPFDEFMTLAIATFSQLRNLEYKQVHSFEFVDKFLDLFKGNTIYTFMDAVTKATTGYTKTVN